jgi:hypothetical protein
MVSPTFLFDSSSLCVYFFPISLDENEYLRGVQLLENFSYSIDMISLGLNGSICMKEKKNSSLGNTFHDSMLSGI